MRSIKSIFDSFSNSLPLPNFLNLATTIEACFASVVLSNLDSNKTVNLYSFFFDLIMFDCLYILDPELCDLQVMGSDGGGLSGGWPGRPKTFSRK